MTPKRTILVGLVLPLLAATVLAETFTSVQPGNWNQPATWAQDFAFPESDDHAICLHAVNVEASRSCDSLTVAAAGMVHTNYGYRDLQVISHARVDGSVFSADGGWPLTVRLLGDLELNGEIACHDWQFTGGGDQHLAMGPAAILAPRHLQLGAGGRLVADTDLRFRAECDLQGGTLVLGGQHDAVFSTDFVTDAVIEADGSTLRFGAGAYISTSTVRAPVLAGQTRIYGEVTCTDATVVTDTLVAHYGYCRLIADELRNEGLIESGDWELRVHVLGDATNHGVWQGHELLLTGAGVSHTLAQLPGTCFAPDVFRLEAGTGPVTIEGTVEVASESDLAGGRLVLGPDAALVLAGGSLDDGVIEADRGILDCRDGVWIRNTTVTDAVLHGEVLVNNGTAFGGETRIEGALDGLPNVTTSFEHVDNAGTVGMSSGAFMLTVTGDLQNRGAWDVTRTTIDGVGDQYVGASDAHPVGAILRLDANLGGTGHVWSRDGVLQPELTGPTLDLEPATSAHHGVWQCHSSEGDSRLITIGEPADPTAVGDAPAAVCTLGNHPNPFNPHTTIAFNLARAGAVRLEVFDPRGRLVTRLIDGARPAGPQSVVWDASAEASGVYLYRLCTAGKEYIGRCTLVK